MKPSVIQMFALQFIKRRNYYFIFANSDFIFYFIWNTTPNFTILTSNILINMTSFFLDLDHYKFQDGDIEY